ncbi:hypothetical protein HYDPIDRAFT_93112 [Hydnomerulius pinastri MD-312]|uniref:FAD-binding PCMH-type domain-containing protein n=1 Tax=Hydnomerulius pinastri MD-312 TaxID=994086 RepID=A0A0C9WDP0_9AGAM|nr:hypothetical protein HYDPIDRAFT_93112 [Hydnomerulius pinastri MD-312]
MKALAAFSLIAARLAATSPTGAECLCTYDETCWPSSSDFSQLQGQVSQPLIYPLPTASACYPVSNPSGNCTAVLENSADPIWRASMPGSMEAPNFETFIFKNGTIDACYSNTTLGIPCGQGSVPVIGVDARSPEDIQAAVNFAVNHNLKLVVKNTGHDFMGRSAARGAFVVWTHNMKNITYNSQFVPQGAPSNETYDAITLGAGVQWHEAYDAINRYGRMMVGGASDGGSVGAAGGWILGGGHSALAPTYGLGVDNVVEMTVVLSTGEYLTVNDHQYSDLYWALRGGGGGTYGILTSVTYRTYPSLPVAFYLFEANATSSSAMQDMFTELMHRQVQFSDDGWAGYGSSTNSSMYFFYIAPNMSTAQANATTQGWTDYAQALTSQGISSSALITQFASWYDWYTEVYSSPGQNGMNRMMASRLLSRDTLENGYQDISKVFFDCGASWNLVAGGKVSEIDPDSVGLNPAWRDAIIEALCVVQWPDGTPSQEIHEKVDEVKSLIKAIHDATPNDSAYFNEASLFEVDWQQTFFGSHYAALKTIKDKYDPHRLFIVAEGVGSEDWNTELTCRI